MWLRKPGPPTEKRQGFLGDLDWVASLRFGLVILRKPARAIPALRLVSVSCDVPTAFATRCGSPGGDAVRPLPQESAELATTANCPTLFVSLSDRLPLPLLGQFPFEVLDPIGVDHHLCWREIVSLGVFVAFRIKGGQLIGRGAG